MLPFSVTASKKLSPSLYLNSVAKAVSGVMPVDRILSPKNLLISVLFPALNPPTTGIKRSVFFTKLVTHLVFYVIY